MGYTPNGSNVLHHCELSLIRRIISLGKVAFINPSGVWIRAVAAQYVVFFASVMLAVWASSPSFLGVSDYIIIRKADAGHSWRRLLLALFTPLVSEPSTLLSVLRVAWLLIGFALMSLAFQQFTQLSLPAYAEQAADEIINDFK